MMQPASANMTPTHPSRGLNHSQLFKHNSMPLSGNPQLQNVHTYQTRGPLNNRQQQQQHFAGFADQDEYIHTSTSKPPYSGPISDHNSSYSQL